MYAKKFIIQDKFVYLLDASEVCSCLPIKTLHNCENVHDDGWTIRGFVEDDVYEFEATHPVFGEIFGNFKEYIVCADSEEGFNHFFDNHPADEIEYDII